jgi:glycosyltransferase involved in cell wall biosynthesis
MKILYVTTISNTVNAFLIPHIKRLIDEGHQVDAAFKIEQEVKPEITEMGCKIHEIPFQRSPLSKDNFKAYKKLNELIVAGKYDLVHTHTPVASAIVRLACKNLSSVKIYYTAHGFHFYKGAPIKNWLIYYPIEKWLSRYTEVLITINNEDYQRAKKSFKAGRVEYIPGVGLDTKKFTNVIIDKSAKRKELGLPEDAFIVLSVGELNKNKNHELIIKALARLNNSKIYYVICGQGPLEHYLREVADKVGIGNRVKLLGLRNDIAEICKAADIFAFPSKREGLGLAALEAMACGLPIVTSNVHGIVDYSVNGKTGFSCNPKNVEEFTLGINTLMNDEELRILIRNYNIKSVKKFDIQESLRIIKSIYADVLTDVKK